MTTISSCCCIQPLKPFVIAYSLHSYWTSTKIPFRLCFHSFCSQRQIPTRSTGSEAYILLRTRFGERGSFYSGPAAWNTLPSDLHNITDTSTFRKRLKNVLFDRAFNWFCWRSWTCRISAPYKFCVDWLIHISASLCLSALCDHQMLPIYMYHVQILFLVSILSV